MKIAVYTIAKNEAKFVRRWADSCKEADYKIIVDTGSTDGMETEVIKVMRGIKYYKMSLKPFRFDDARNFSLNLIPDDVDVCICLDMDEVLVEGWREIVEKYWEDTLDRLRYNYVWSFVDGKPGVTYHADKIHTRHGLRWVNPVHEVLHKDARLGEERQKFIEETLIEHYPDVTKPRSQYLELLALSVKERPHDDRNVHYYARELMFAGSYVEAIEFFKLHINMPEARWNAEKSASHRFMGDCLWALGHYEQALGQFNLAIQMDNTSREAWVAAAQAYRAMGDWDQCKSCCEGALKLTERPNSYINEPIAWSEWPNEMLKEAEDALKTTSAAA